MRHATTVTPAIGFCLFCAARYYGSEQRGAKSAAGHVDARECITDPRRYR